MKPTSPHCLLLVAMLLTVITGCASAGERSAPRSPAYRAASAPPAEDYSAAPGRHGSALLYLPGHSARQLVRFEVIDGMAVRGGDIMLGPVEQLPFLYALPRANPNVHSAVATTNSSHLWPRGVIPFEIDLSVSAEKRQQIAWAIDAVNRTELELRPRGPTDADFVNFSESGGGYGCSSYIGRVGGSQKIQVRGCSEGGSIIHEIMHAAGFDHEQCRGDRDAFVTIHWNEIPSEHHHAFDKTSGGQDIGPYDYQSIMHYSRGAFSSSGRDTITPHTPNANIGQREGLSQLDRAAITHLYQNGGPPGGPPGGLPGGLPPSVVLLPGMPPIELPQGLPPFALPQGLPALPELLPGFPASLPQLPSMPVSLELPALPPFPSQ